MTQIALYNSYYGYLVLILEKLEEFHFLLGVSKKEYLMFLTFRVLIETSFSSFRRGYSLLWMNNIKKFRKYKFFRVAKP